jgi:hypothetical protein
MTHEELEEEYLVEKLKGTLLIMWLSEPTSLVQEWVTMVPEFKEVWAGPASHIREETFEEYKARKEQKKMTDEEMIARLNLLEANLTGAITENNHLKKQMRNVQSNYRTLRTQFAVFKLDLEDVGAKVEDLLDKEFEPE